MKRVIRYLVFTFTLTYISHGLLALLTTRDIIEFQSFMGQILFILGGSSPAIFGIIFIIRGSKKNGLNALKDALLSYKYSVSLWMYTIITPVILSGIYLFLRYIIANKTVDTTVPFYLFFFLLISSVIFGGIEEIGWRGVLQEELMGKGNIVPIALVIGIIWGLWHIPLFFIEEVSHYTFDFVPFLLGALMFSTYLTWLYAKTKSLLLVVLFHASINASATIGFRFVFNHDIVTYVVLIVLLCTGIVLLIRQDRIGNVVS